MCRQGCWLLVVKNNFNLRQHSYLRRRSRFYVGKWAADALQTSLLGEVGKAQSMLGETNQWTLTPILQRKAFNASAVADCWQEVVKSYSLNKTTALIDLEKK